MSERAWSGGALPQGLAFTPKPAVRWFQPGVLLKTGQQVALSGAFAGFSDKREQQAARPAPVLDQSAGDELWLDYVCDLADGFDATATIASLVAQPRLTIPGLERPEGGLPRGEVLVLGGDEVYPFASIEEYKDRLIGPYSAMLCEPELTGDPAHDLALRAAAPRVVAVPGNHDWYDGLTAFTRLFMLPSTDSARWPWLGGWKSEQQRSYFAVKLPQHWWLWGIDIQLDTYIDNGQLAWFKDVVAPLVEPDDGIILCSASPSWVEAGRDAPDAYDNLDYFERKIIEPTKARLRVSLTGDHHYYARFECREHPERVGEQKIIAGGGGAYLAATHHLPTSLSLPAPESAQHTAERVRTYSLLDGAGRPTSYPDPARSKRLRWGVFQVGIMNGPGFAALVGVAYALWSYTLLRSDNRAWSWLEMATRIVMPFGPVLVFVIVGAALVGFTHERRPSKRWTARGLAFVHLLLHAALVVTLAWAMERAWANWFDDGEVGMWFRLGTAASVGVVGALLGPLVLALYLLLADRFRVNTNELFAAQRIEDFKNFLRFHIDADGVLTVYPIAVDRVATRWRSVQEPATTQGPWLVPDRPIGVHLIEDPIRIDRIPGGSP